MRLACHGLDRGGNDVAIGLATPTRSSPLVQAVRKTAPTARYTRTLGPFFVGHVLGQAPPW